MPVLREERGLKLGKRFFWLKLGDDFFRDKAIKKLRKIAGGDTYTIIYLKMLIKAIQQDNKLYFEGIEDNFADELALDLEEDPENVRVTLTFLQQKGLVEIVNDDEFILTSANKMTGSETESAVRMRRMRDKKTSQCDGDVTGQLRFGDIEKEIEKELELEIDKDKRISKDILCRTNVQRAIEAWNDLGVNPVQKMSKSSNRYKMLAARVKEYGIDDVLKAIDNVQRSAFLQGENSRSWMIDLEWFVKPNNFPKVLEGKYNDKAKELSYHGGGNSQWQ